VHELALRYRVFRKTVGKRPAMSKQHGSKTVLVSQCSHSVPRTIIIAAHVYWTMWGVPWGLLHPLLLGQSPSQARVSPRHLPYLRQLVASRAAMIEQSRCSESVRVGHLRGFMLQSFWPPSCAHPKHHRDHHSHRCDGRNELRRRIFCGLGLYTRSILGRRRRRWRRQRRLQLRLRR
jgi:hypothetical protein